MYALGVLVYFASWLPLIYASDAAWSKSAAGLLAPAYTPLICLTGIALIGGSRPYALARSYSSGCTSITIAAHRLLRKRQSA